MVYEPLVHCCSFSLMECPDCSALHLVCVASRARRIPGVVAGGAPTAHLCFSLSLSLTAKFRVPHSYRVFERPYCRKSLCPLQPTCARTRSDCLHPQPAATLRSHTNRGALISIMAALHARCAHARLYTYAHATDAREAGRCRSMRDAG